MASVRLLLFVPIVLVAASAWAQQGPLSVCVTDPEGDISAETQKRLGDSLRAAVERYGQMKVLRGPGLSTRLLRLRARCTGTKPPCLAAMGRMARADRLLYTQVAKEKEATRIEIHLVDVAKKLVLDSYTLESIVTENELTEQVNRALQMVLGSRSMGQLKVSSNVVGAEVWLDGELIGRTPLVLTRELASGEHRLRLRCEGCREAEQVFRVEDRQGITMHVELEMAPAGEEAKMSGGKDEEAQPSAAPAGEKTVVESPSRPAAETQAAEPPPAAPSATAPPRISTARRPAVGEDLTLLFGQLQQMPPAPAPAVGESAKESKPLWKNWWFWTALGVVAAGSVTLGLTLGLGGGEQIPAGHGRVIIEF